MIGNRRSAIKIFWKYWDQSCWYLPSQSQWLHNLKNIWQHSMGPCSLKDWHFEGYQMLLFILLMISPIKMGSPLLCIVISDHGRRSGEEIHLIDLFWPQESKSGLSFDFGLSVGRHLERLFIMYLISDLWVPCDPSQAQWVQALTDETPSWGLEHPN